MRAKIPQGDAKGKAIYVRLRGHVDSEIRAFAAKNRMPISGAVDLACEMFLRDRHLLDAFGKMLDERLRAKE